MNMAHKLPIHNASDEHVGDAVVPSLFDEPYRPDLISRVVLAIEANMRQPYGAHPEAGKNSSSKLSRRRRDYKGSYGHGISRVPRKILSRNGTRMNWVGALAPGTVKGRRAHPPKTTKDWSRDVPVQEKKKATRSALAATLDKSIVAGRGHKLPASFPFIIDDSFEAMTTTKDVVNALHTLGFSEELSRSASGTRAGRGKMRGRATIVPRSVLFVISKPSALVNAARNIPGIEVVLAKDVNAKHLAPGCHPGRLTLYTKSALTSLESRFAGAASVAAAKTAASPSNQKAQTATQPKAKTSAAAAKVAPPKKSRQVAKEEKSK